MELILLQKVRNLGDLGDQVKVRAGYGRNYLVPKGMALPATKANVQYFESQKAELQKASSERIDNARGRADKFKGRSFTIAMRSSDEGKLYGSVGPQEIAEQVNKDGLELDPKEVTLPEGGAIRNVGEHHAVLQLHPEVEVEITVIVAQLTDAGVKLPVSKEEEAVLLGEEYVPEEEQTQPEAADAEAEGTEDEQPAP